MRSGLVTVARQRAGDAVRSQLRLQASLVALTEEVVSERVRRITDVVGPKHVAPLLEKESSSSIDHARKFSMDFGTIDFSAGEITFSNSNLYSLASTSGSLFNNSEESRIRSRMNADSFGQMSLDQRSTHLHNTLKQYFGHDHFRPGQFEVIDALLRRQHCVAILPTGHGKSLCYQLPSLVTGKPTLVISPLIALMQEQATSLKLKGFDAAFSGKGVAYHQDWEELDVLFMSPEAAVLQRERLEMTDFGLIAVDEAHCVSEWGSSFRSTYRELGFLRKIHPEVPHLLITATATEMVANDIRSVFNLKDKYKLVTHSFNRHNLHYSVRELDKNTPATILKMVRDAEAQNEVTIIYTLTVDECNRAHEALKKGGVTAGKYNGPMTMTDRMNEQEKFMSGFYNTIVCTVAFGMGIDKPNVRHVIHYGRVKSMTDYYQQTGRAGRDGLAARCTLFISTANMVSKMSFVLFDKISPVFEEAALQEMLAVVNFCELDERICRRVPLLAHFEEKYTVPAGGCGACDHCDVDYVYKGKPVDIAFIAVRVLKLFHNARSALPTMMAVTTLKGSQSGKVPNIPGFGAARDLSVEMITEGMMQLQASGHLSRDVYKKAMYKKATEPSVWMGWRITEEGRKWFSGRSKKPGLLIKNPRVALLKVMAKDMNLPEVEQYENERSKAAEAARRTLGADLVGGRPFFPLFESLKVLRQGQAESTGVSAGQLLNDSIVQALCRIRPSNVDAFRRVPGVPGLVTDSPAQEYVDAIISFCSVKGYPTDVVDTFGAKLAAEAAQKMLEFERQDPPPAVVLSNAKTFRAGSKPHGKRRVMS